MHGPVRREQGQPEQIPGERVPVQGRGEGERGACTARAAAAVRGGGGRVVGQGRRGGEQVVGRDGHAAGGVRAEEGGVRDIRGAVLHEAGGERGHGRVRQAETRPAGRAGRASSGGGADRHDILDAEEAGTEEDAQEGDNQPGRHGGEGALRGQHGEEEGDVEQEVGRGDDGQVFREVGGQVPPPQEGQGEVLARAERGEVPQVQQAETRARQIQEHHDEHRARRVVQVGQQHVATFRRIVQPGRLRPGQHVLLLLLSSPIAILKFLSSKDIQQIAECLILARFNLIIIIVFIVFCIIIFAKFFKFPYNFFFFQKYRAFVYA